SWASGSEAASLQRCCRVALGCSCSCDGALAVERCEHGGLQFAQRLADLVERLPGLRQFPSNSTPTIRMLRLAKSPPCSTEGPFRCVGGARPRSAERPA